MKHREIVFRSTSQIAGARTVNQLSAFFFDVRKKKGLRISADPFSLMRKIGFVVVLMLGYLLRGSAPIAGQNRTDTDNNAQDPMADPLEMRMKREGHDM